MSSLSLLLLSLTTVFPLSSAHSTTLTLTPGAAAPPLATPWQRLNHLAGASTSRAHHLKQHKTDQSSATEVSLFPRGYGGYSISLSFGTPPQTLQFVMDTGSSVVWFPCTQNYSCSSCNFVGVTNITTFSPKSSSSTVIVGCENPKCKSLFPNVHCDQCDLNPTTCNKTCPPYILEYGSGSTSGLLISESLDFPDKTVNNFVVGCSVFSSQQPAGIAGFGRGPVSLPAQMGLKRFSYCLLSHLFDDTPESSELILDTAGAAATKGGEIKYTPFRKNPPSSNRAFLDFYYVLLRRISVGGERVKVPYRFLVVDDGGHGGTIVDSGTTLTFMDRQIFDLVAEEFEKQVGKHYSRAREIETESGLRPCFNVSGEDVIELPQLRFHFRGDAIMELPLADYFSFLDDAVVCMTLTTSNSTNPKGKVGPGPAIILGNYQQQNFYMEYDLEHERLGFRKQLCKSD